MSFITTPFNYRIVYCLNRLHCHARCVEDGQVQLCTPCFICMFVPMYILSMTRGRFLIYWICKFKTWLRCQNVTMNCSSLWRKRRFGWHPLSLSHTDSCKFRTLLPYFVFCRASEVLQCVVRCPYMMVEATVMLLEHLPVHDMHTLIHGFLSHYAWLAFLMYLGSLC